MKKDATEVVRLELTGREFVELIGYPTDYVLATLNTKATKLSDSDGVDPNGEVVVVLEKKVTG